MFRIPHQTGFGGFGGRWYLITPWSSAELMACTCLRQCARLLWLLHCKIIRGVRVFTHDFIIPQMAWVRGKMRALLSIAGTWAACGPLLDSWQVDRSPTRERQFHGPHCLHWLLLWSQESRARDSRKPTTESRGSWAEEVIIIIICHIIIIIIIIIITVIIIAGWPHKPGVPCVFTAALPFYWLRALILIRLRASVKNSARIILVMR